MLSTGSREWACDKHIGGKAHKGTLVAGPDRRAVLELLGLGGLATVLPPADDCGLPDPLGTHLFGILRIVLVTADFSNEYQVFPLECVD